MAIEFPLTGVTDMLARKRPPHPRTRSYLALPFQPHKQKYLDMLVEVEPLLPSTRIIGNETEEEKPNRILVAGVGGRREPMRLLDHYQEPVISLDLSAQVIESHRLANKESAIQHEQLLIHGDLIHPPFAPGSIKILSLSSAEHEAMSMAIRKMTGESLTPSKDTVVRNQLDNLKKLIAPGGIFAMQDIMPQPEGKGELFLNSTAAYNFTKVFIDKQEEIFGRGDRYTVTQGGRKIEGNLVDLSEIWWHFRWWWVDNIRTKASDEVVDRVSNTQGGRKIEGNLVDLSEIWWHFRWWVDNIRTKASDEVVDRVSKRSGETIDGELLRRSVGPGLNLLDQQMFVFGCRASRDLQVLGEFGELNEVYNLTEGVADFPGLVESWFNGDSGDLKKWSVVCSVFRDDRDDTLLKRHFRLSDPATGEQVPIKLERMHLFARRLKDPTSLIKIADKQGGRRIYPPVSDNE